MKSEARTICWRLTITMAVPVLVALELRCPFPTPPHTGAHDSPCALPATSASASASAPFSPHEARCPGRALLSTPCIYSLYTPTRPHKRRHILSAPFIAASNSWVMLYPAAPVSPAQGHALSLAPTLTVSVHFSFRPYNYAMRPYVHLPQLTRPALRTTRPGNPGATAASSSSVSPLHAPVSRCYRRAGMPWASAARRRHLPMTAASPTRRSGCQCSWPLRHQ
jgi:hypothetical protein